MNDLNAFLLSDAAPHGKPFTAGELLAEAEQLLGRQSAGAADEVTIESLVSIGQQYVSQDEDDNARRVLARALRPLEEPAGTGRGDARQGGVCVCRGVGARRRPDTRADL